MSKSIRLPECVRQNHDTGGAGGRAGGRRLSRQYSAICPRLRLLHVEKPTHASATSDRLASAPRDVWLSFWLPTGVCKTTISQGSVVRRFSGEVQQLVQQTVNERPTIKHETATCLDVPRAGRVSPQCLSRATVSHAVYATAVHAATNTNKTFACHAIRDPPARSGITAL
jgi:hypothetical protein